MKTKLTYPTESQVKEASEVIKGYTHDANGRITQPGKFEGEPIFAPYYYGIGLEGFADSDDGKAYGFRFKNSDVDFVLWPELKKWLGRKRSLRIVEDSQGFIHCY